MATDCVFLFFVFVFVGRWKVRVPGAVSEKRHTLAPLFGDASGTHRVPRLSDEASPGCRAATLLHPLSHHCGTSCSSLHRGGHPRWALQDLSDHVRSSPHPKAMSQPCKGPIHVGRVGLTRPSPYPKAMSQPCKGPCKQGELG